MCRLFFDKKQYNFISYFLWTKIEKCEIIGLENKIIIVIYEKKCFNHGVSHDVDCSSRSRAINN